MIRLGAGLAIVAAACPATPGLAQSAPTASAKLDPEALSIANEIVELAYPPERRQALLMGALSAVLAQAQAAPTGAGPPDPGVEAIFDRFRARAEAAIEPIMAVDSAETFAAFARIYARKFSRDELIQIRAFVSTPAGARFIQQSAETVTDPEMAALDAAHSARVFAAVQPLKDQARQELMEYFTKPRN
jgi:hypothetical protein